MMATSENAQPTRTLTDLHDLAGAVEATAVVIDVQPERDEFGRSYATGKRKNAIARVWIKPGSGKLEVNGKDGSAYFARPVLRMIINQPFLVVRPAGPVRCLLPRSSAAVFRAKPVRFATASPRR